MSRSRRGSAKVMSRSRRGSAKVMSRSKFDQLKSCPGQLLEPSVDQLESSPSQGLAGRGSAKVMSRSRRGSAKVMSRSRRGSAKGMSNSRLGPLCGSVLASAGLCWLVLACAGLCWPVLACWSQLACAACTLTNGACSVPLQMLTDVLQVLIESKPTTFHPPCRVESEDLSQ